MIVLVFVLSLVVAILSFTTDIRNKPIRYFGVMWILIGLGCIKPTVEEHLLTSFGPYLVGTRYPYILQFAGTLCSLLALHLAPFFYLLFGLACSGFWENANGFFSKNTIKILAFMIPAISFGVVLPRSLSMYCDNLTFLLLSSWTVPYTMVAIGLLIHSYRKAAGKRAKKQALMLCYLVIPAGIASLLTCYILRAFGFHQVWLINRWFVVATFGFYLYGISHYGLLGIKLRIEKMRLDTTMKAVVSGTSILNHTIKNEVLKIIMSTTTIQSMKERNSPVCEADLQVILNSARHLETMAHRIKATMQDIQLKEAYYSLAGLIDKALRLVSPYLTERQVKIVKEYSPETMFKCDETHMIEVLINLLQNAIEAIPPASEGEIRIKVETTKNHTLLAIKDNGAGIPPEVLPHIMDPFFSTKPKHVNYGLGLSYCYRVVQKHGGTIEIESEPAAGTSVWLSFPARRFTCTAQKQETTNKMCANSKINRLNVTK